MKHHLTKLFGFTEKLQGEEIKEILVNDICANPFQPRRVFDDETIEELAQSITQFGVLQPIIVRAVPHGYELVAGERRWRAAIRAELAVVPAIVRNYDDEQSATIALIENLQREQLSPIEEANAYQQLIILQSLTQEQLADQLGIKQSTVANKLRLLQLGDDVKSAIADRKITEKHARTLLKVSDSSTQNALLHEIIDKDYSVKQLDTRIKFLLEEQKIIKTSNKRTFAIDIRLALNTIRQTAEMIHNSGIKIETTEINHEEAIEVKLMIYKKK